MQRSIFPVLVSSLTLLSTLKAEDEIFSGPQPGEPIAPFQVVLYSGPNAGEEVEVLDSIGDQPATLVFVHKITRPAFRVIRELGNFAASPEGGSLQLRLIWLTNDPNETKGLLERISDSMPPGAINGISTDGIEGPGNYGLNREVTLTILVAKNQKVTANFALLDPNETDAPAIFQAIGDVLGRPIEAPSNRTAQDRVTTRDEPMRDTPARGSRDRTERSFEPSETTMRLQLLERQVEILTDALNEARREIARLSNRPAPPMIPQTAAIPGPTGETVQAMQERGGPPVELQRMMRLLLSEETTDQDRVQIVDRLVEWVGAEDPTRRRQFIEFAQRAIRAEFGSSVGREQLQRVLKRYEDSKSESPNN